MNFSFNLFHLVNTYGAFGSVTKVRKEIIIEGTTDENLTSRAEWKAGRSGAEEVKVYG